MRRVVLVPFLSLACADTRDDAMATGTAAGSVTGDLDDDDSSGPLVDPEGKLDVGGGDATATAGDGELSCKVGDMLDADPADCEVAAPPDSFEPEIQWSWTASDGNSMVLATPLVVNLTDDNGDGAIDLCDTPDIVVAAMKSIAAGDLPSSDPSYIYVLDGETGQEHFKIQVPAAKFGQPAVGDVDGDGIAEIVAVLDKPNNTFAVFEHDGTMKYMSIPAPKFMFSEAIGLADLDANGDVEIVIGEQVYEHDGELRWFGVEGAQPDGATAVSVDLDDDGMLEVVLGHSAFRHDGELYWLNLDIGDGGSGWASGYPSIGNFDEDDYPEVLVTNELGISMLEHDGTAKYIKQTPTGESPTGLNWARPTAVHDFDGDGAADYALGSSEHFTVYNADASILWTREIEDLSGCAAGTAFDFLGDGTAEAMYADEHTFWTFDGLGGESLFDVPRLSRTLVEFPVVADIDNDGSAEVLVVSNETLEGEDDGGPALVAIRDAQDRWIPARRIWNQHQYHVTNVREDGTIPQHQPKHWLQLNTVRVQAQIGQDGVCQPPVEG